MIGKILLGIISFFTSLVYSVLTPIDNLIQTALPDLSNAISAVGAFLNIGFSCIGWVISLFGISPSVISLIVVYYTFKLTLPLAISGIKLVVRWYNALKP